ncbi:hypothetical protein ACIQD5_28785 [Streptomyces microflavus]|uniref:hypothetical protein n=1 Tax=Streptomyces TaxID=1883 RepID=UPI000B917AD7|nr:hypothetical protein [Streptomyces sp. 2R]OXY94785.1 hypothetical protein BEH93_34540 [Streptomyces sp. 2R]
MRSHGPGRRAVDGTGGVHAGTIGTLDSVPVVLSEADWLTPDQQVRLLAVASVVTGAVRLIARDPGGAILQHRPRPRCPLGRCRVDTGRDPVNAGLSTRACVALK